jgi:hypothetical protein
MRSFGFGAPATPETASNPLGSPQYAVDSLKACQAAANERGLAAIPPVSVWRWQPIATIVLPAILLAIVAAV